MPLLRGYSREVISANIGALLREGEPRAVATARALAAARVAFFRRHPQGALPNWLAFPAGARLRRDYQRDGRPIHLSPSVEKLRDTMQSLYENRPSRHVRANPAPRAAVAQAARRIARFTGMPDVTTRKITVSRQSDVVLDIGRVDGILYSTVRDGVAEKYIHRFARHSRPLLTASPDGKRLYLLGGAYTFTDRGIVDRRRSRPSRPRSR